MSGCDYSIIFVFKNWFTVHDHHDQAVVVLLCCCLAAAQGTRLVQLSGSLKVLQELADSLTAVKTVM